MSAPFLSALGELDGKLQAAEAQLELLSAAVPLEEPSLIHAFREACQHSEALAALIRAERPQAQWNDREELDHLLLELEEAVEARQDQRRRDRLLALAGELDAGAVRHRFEARTAQLNTLRLDAVRELRAQAAVSGHAKELPGPDAHVWLNWAFNLKDDKDEAIIARLQRDFSALEAFTGEMEEIYWLPGRGSQPPIAPPPGASAGDSTFSPSAERDNTPAPPVARAESARRDRASDPAFASAYEPAVAQPVVSPSPSPVEVAQQWETTTATLLVEQAPEAVHVAAPAQVVTDSVPGPSASVLEAPPDDAGPAAEAASSSPTVAEAAAEPVAAAEHGASSAEAGRTEGGESAIARLMLWRKRSVTAWATVGGFVVLSALFFVILHHLHERNNKPASTVQAATTGAVSASADDEASGEPAPASTGSSAAGTPASARPPLLHKQASEGPQDSIALSLEQCGRSTDHVECWGYVSNQGGAGSRVSLDRVDVVDGRGNSFSLVRNGQFAFPTGESSNIAAGDRVRYTIKIPDKDLDARTLTLYMDLSNPRSLEYTFRDIPIAR